MPASNKPSSLPKNITSPPGVDLSASASETVTVIMGRSKSLGIGLNPDNIITEIDAGSVAARHGLKLGDVIVGWQGQQLSGRRLQDVMTPAPMHIFSVGRGGALAAAVQAAAPAPARKTVSRQFSFGRAFGRKKSKGDKDDAAAPPPPPEPPLPARKAAAR